MTYAADAENIDAIIPGVTAAYAALKSPDSMGLQTSTGSFYNHTLFGRDASNAAKFVSDFDHELVAETILVLAKFQGVQHNTRTQEEPGRIHHEYRDFRTWKGTLFENIPFFILRNKWDIKDRRLLSYFSLDTTASFIRLTHKHATYTDASILQKSVTNRHGQTRTIQESAEAAAEWIMEKIDDRGLIGEVQTNEYALPFQTYQDSLYARQDGILADYRNPIIYVEVQSLAADALHDMAHMLPDHKMAHAWRDTALRLQYTMVQQFGDEKGFLASAIDSRGKVDVANVSAGWTLNTSLWTEMSQHDQQRYVTAIVEKLFSDEFLTTVGIRSRAKSASNPISKTLDYHGSETVWPMFSFMVVEGLRRHRLHGLANQLEHRIVNGLNAVGNFPEFIIVTRNDSVIMATKDRLMPQLNVQMKPEKNIGFSVVPAMVMGHRAATKPRYSEPNRWQRELDERILATIPRIERVASSQAINAIGAFEYRHLRRWMSTIRTMYYFWQQRK